MSSGASGGISEPVERREGRLGGVEKGEGTKKQERGVFVTVGTTQFDELIKACTTQQFRQVTPANITAL